jgi:SAM-dependent methyltransferase
MKQWLREHMKQTNLGYKMYLAAKAGYLGTPHRPKADWANAVLRTQTDVDESMVQVRKLGLPLVDNTPKNWDTLAALDAVLNNTTPDAHVFDAGGELYSMLLPWLFLYGYRNLIAGNIAFERRTRKGPIVYDYIDITTTSFQAGHFDAVTCLSVIEHGVDLDAYFKEMSRILKPGSILVTSTDYYETKVDTRGQFAYGAPIHIFDKTEILDAVELAKRYGLELTSPLDLTCTDRVVHWKRYDLRYTFVVFTLRKSRSGNC